MESGMHFLTIAWQKLRLGGLLLYLLILTIFWSTVSICLFLFDSTGRLTHFYGARPWSRMMLWASRVKVTMRGSENLHTDGENPPVLVSNHQSLFDILALLAALPLDFKFVVKKELRKVPLWGYAMDKAGYLFIDRAQSGNVRYLIQEAAEKMRRGSSMLFFAEGTRSVDGLLGPFKRGAFVLAAQSGCQVVPLVIQGSREVVPKKSFNIRPGRITVTALPPLTDPSLLKSSKRLMERVREMMLSQLGQSDQPA
jgi:1-acyl-sn-glycerol-3-phosphate acyltransferase